MRTTSGTRLPSSAAVPDAVAGAPAATLCRLEDCADCVRHALARDIGGHFTELTGLQLHLLRGSGTAVCPEVERLRGRNTTIPIRCALCADHIWSVGTRGDGGGRVFAGACGRLNCRVGIRAADGCALSLVIQTQDPQPGVPPLRGIASEPAIGPAGRRDSARAGCDIHLDAVQCGADGFGQAVTLLKIVARGLESTLEAEQLKWALDDARRVWQTVLARDVRLRRALGKRLPELFGEPAVPETTPQADRLVEQVREFVLRHYQCPAIGLGNAAASVHRSASYISTLFARATGMSFHHYLQELRLAKALELLRDPSLTVAKVAEASGYASADWFRHSFKHHLGRPPSDWRRSHLHA